MQIEIRVDPSRVRRGVGDLAARLKREVPACVRIVAGTERQPLPSSADLLLSLERLIYGLPGPRASDRVALGELPWCAEPGSTAPDLVVDLSSDSSPPKNARVIRPLYDGENDEAALMGALLAGRTPVLEVEDVAQGRIAARGMPARDNAGTLCEAIENVAAGLATLIVAVARGRPPADAPGERRPAAFESKRAARFAARALAHATVRRLYHLCCNAPHWRIYWRFVNGADLWDTRRIDAADWQVLPDPGLHFYADPFPFEHEGRSYVFFEDLDHRTQKGVISLVPFGPRGPEGPAQVVLEEPWHLSYPFLIARDGHIWMIPESSTNGTILLYRADPFPHRWVKEAALLACIEASDATVIEHGGRLWMFVATRAGAGSWSDTLSLFSAERLVGPWAPHPANPVLIDQASARPAGNMVMRGGRLWRPVQDCTDGYGTGIGLAEVTELTESGFGQKVHAVLRSPPAWPGRRLHTLNRAGRIECLDGAAHSPKTPLLRPLLK